MPLCHFTTTDTPQILTCPICKRDQRSNNPPERTYRECRIIEPCEEAEPTKTRLWQQLKSGMLGDVTETILTSVGLTKSRWEQIIGGPCGCGERQAWLNKVGQALISGQSSGQPTDPPNP